MVGSRQCFWFPDPAFFRVFLWLFVGLWMHASHACIHVHICILWMCGGKPNRNMRGQNKYNESWAHFKLHAHLHAFSMHRSGCCMHECMYTLQRTITCSHASTCFRPLFCITLGHVASTTSTWSICCALWTATSNGSLKSVILVSSIRMHSPTIG